MRRKSDKSKQPEGRDNIAKPVSRRAFLSSVAATGAVAIWPTNVPNAEARLPGNSPPPPHAALPPPAGQEASYEWYLPQYTDPTIYTPIGLPADPAETVVTPSGELVYANELHKHVKRIPGTPYAVNALAFALFDGAQIVPMGVGQPARQSLEKGYLPIVITSAKHGNLEIRETTYSEPLEASAYQTGMESTLAWAVFEITNHGAEARPLTLLAAQMGDQTNLKLDLTYNDGVVLEKGSALFSARVPAGFKVEFHRVFPEGAEAAAEADPHAFLRSYSGLFNALAVQGRIAAGETVRMAFNRRLDFPGTLHWGPAPRPPVAREALTGKSPERALISARAIWSALSRQVSRFDTPDQTLNNIVNKAMLDGYFLTKRWNGKYIVFDSVNYRCQWDDSCTKWFYALDLMGDHATAERLLDTVFARQGQRKPAGTRTHAGCFSDVTNTAQDGSSASWSCCNGWALWAIGEHARLAHDPVWIDKHQQQILDGCEWIRRERRFSKEKPDNPCAGLLYGKFVCDMPDQGNVSGVGYFTYTDAISFMGLSGIGRLLAEWGHPQGASLLQEAELYRQDIIAAIDRLTDKSQDPWYIPWMLSAPRYVQRYLYDVCGPINLASGGVLSRDDERIQHVIRWIIDRMHHGSLEEATAGITQANEGAMFYSQDLAIVLLELGRVEDFLRIFYTLLASDISHETLTTCEWRGNTQPHIHSISSLIRMFRTMLIQERDGALYLLQGTPRRWLEQGKTLTVTDAPTWYGDLSLHSASDLEAGTIRVQLTLPERIGSVPIHLRLRLPGSRLIQRVQVNGRPHTDVRGDWIVLKGSTGKVEIVARMA